MKTNYAKGQENSTYYKVEDRRVDVNKEFNKKKENSAFALNRVCDCVGVRECVA